MIWWHQAWQPLWGHANLLDRTLGWYETVVADIAEAIEKYHAKLLILDPMSSYIGENCSMNNANETRAEFNHLIAVAKNTGCAIVIIAHMNKMRDINPLYRTNGSIDIAGAARSILAITRTPNKEAPAERYMVQVKSNLDFLFVRSAHFGCEGLERFFCCHFHFRDKVHSLFCHLKKNCRACRGKVRFHLHHISFCWCFFVRCACDCKNTSCSTRNINRTVGTIKRVGISHLVHMSDNHDCTASILCNRYQMIKLCSCFVGIVH